MSAWATTEPGEQHAAERIMARQRGHERDEPTAAAPYERREQMAAAYSAGRREFTYLEARYQAELRAMRGYVRYGVWAAVFFCPLFLFAVMAQVGSTSATWAVAPGLFTCAVVLGMLPCGVGTGYAKKDEALCGLRGEGADLCWAACYVICLPGLLLAAGYWLRLFAMGVTGH